MAPCAPARTVAAGLEAGLAGLTALQELSLALHSTMFTVSFRRLPGPGCCQMQQSSLRRTYPQRRVDSAQVCTKSLSHHVRVSALACHLLAFTRCCRRHCVTATVLHGVSPIHCSPAMTHSHCLAPAPTLYTLSQALRPDFPAALGRLTGLKRLTLDVASFAPAGGGAMPAALSRMTALQSLDLLGDWRHTVRLHTTAESCTGSSAIYFWAGLLTQNTLRASLPQAHEIG